ncbi:hypothetical protein FH609_000435 [Streptomyces sp. 3MP-14]|uniref:Uncharacterized protein n=1 Tax=Streptomyces mimosae TaxID=2586635 RepID=A0A5N6AT78_9ACTN|nr:MULTISPECIES: DUF6303 family protein [Streptomyces]KAB8171120.1 hypothetical protein FH607_002035 [Streptomyces mimosae]KAB8179528.1 hypothetical protein FH609_000435 [Streptomyces sp. 3MP-14]
MSNAPTHTALFGLRCCGALFPEPTWNLTVATCPGQVSDWPTHTWSGAADTPTLPERDEALASLGFAVVPGEEWSWTEAMCGFRPDGPPHVRLFAAVPVRPLGGGLA